MPKNAAQNYINADFQPPDMNSVNWKAAPLHFKLYRNCEQIPCAYKPGGLPEGLAEDGLRQAQLGQMLADIYGFTRQCHLFREDSQIYQSTTPQTPVGQEPQNQSFHTMLLRTVPSGGALFPCELYLLVGPSENIPVGLYHYDAAHHALDILRQGDCSTLLHTSLAYPGDTPAAYALLLSCFFWKDGFKYDGFSYRLQGLDIGAVIAQSEIITNHYALEATIHYQFLDQALNDLIGLDPLHESIYAVITLAPAHQTTLNVEQTQPSSMPIEVTRPLPLAEQLESIARWPLPEAVHRASLMEVREDFRELGCLPPIEQLECRDSRVLSTPDRPLDLWEARYERQSAQGFFQPVPLSEQQFAQLLLACTHRTTNDLDGQSDHFRHTLLYCVVNRVENIPAGVYCYHPKKHALEVIRIEDVQSKFQVQRWLSPNLFHMSACLLPVAHYQSGFQVYDDRWYRMQNMEAGIMVQHLYLAAAALKLGCRASLGYHVSAMNTFLDLPDEYTSLIQVLIAPESQAYHYYAQSLLF